MSRRTVLVVLVVAQVLASGLTCTKMGGFYDKQTVRNEDFESS